MDDIIAKHEKAIEILMAIKYFERRIILLNESINGFLGSFPQLRRKYVNDLDTVKRCLARMKYKYSQLNYEI